MCKRCNDTGRETVIEEDRYSCQWHRVNQPCRCTREFDWGWVWVFLALGTVFVLDILQGLK